MFKHLTTIILVLILFSSSSFALEPSSNKLQTDLGYRNSIDLGYNPGGLSLLNLALYSSILNIETILPYSNLFFGCEIQKLSSSGTFSANYMRKLNKWLWIGGNISYENTKIYLFSYETFEESTNRLSILPIMAVTKADWLRRTHISLYSKLGLGITAIFAEGKSEKIKMSMQLTPIGFEFGGNHVFGFLEAGIGLQGCLIGGVRCRF